MRRTAWFASTELPPLAFEFEMAHRRQKSLHVDELYAQTLAHTRILTAQERRRVLIYIQEIGDTSITELDGVKKPISNVGLARLFQVDERTIRADKLRILNDAATQLTPEAQALVVARHMQDLDDLISASKRGLYVNESGTLGERFYVETLLKLFKERRETYENVGVIRKELGTMNVNEEHWIATADVGSGALGVHRSDEQPQSDQPVGTRDGLPCPLDTPDDSQ